MGSEAVGSNDGRLMADRVYFSCLFAENSSFLPTSTSTAVTTPPQAPGATFPMPILFARLLVTRRSLSLPSARFSLGRGTFSFWVRGAGGSWGGWLSVGWESGEGVVSGSGVQGGRTGGRAGSLRLLRRDMPCSPVGGLVVIVII
jgi:hypothetical protein